MDRDSFDIRPLLDRVWQQRVRIAVGTLLAAALMFGASFLIPKTYRATAVILPPEESDLLSNMSLAQKALSKFPRFGILDDYFTPADTYKAILLSRTVQESLLVRFDLKKVYRIKSTEKALKLLKNRYKVRLNPDGTIAISADDGDPRRAAAMANQLLGLLDRFNVEKRNTSARRTRVFLETRLAETDSLLKRDEALLQAYQQKHHAVAPTSLAGSDVRGAAEIMARKMQLEIRLGILRSYLSENQDQVVQARLELAQLNRQIDALPRLENDLARLVRDLKIREQVFVLLTSELEQARIRETMDTPTVQVLDVAQTPERQQWPKRTLLAGAVGVLAFVIQVLAVVLPEARGPRSEA